jgi:SAM-dependent methyltransferase
VIGELYEHTLADRASPGDESLLDRCEGPTLDIGSGPGRLILALAERGVPALGIDITPHAIDLARSGGAMALLRDVFDRVPGTGRWATVLLVNGNIGIGGDPAALLRRVGQLLAPRGHALVELDGPGRVGADDIVAVAPEPALVEVETWSIDGRWFASILSS